MKTTFLLFLSIFLLASSCHEKEEPFTPPLPPITMTGLNTFGCYIEGQLLTPRHKVGDLFIDTNRALRYMNSGQPPNNAFNEIIVYDNKSENKGSMSIHIPSIHEAGEGIYSILESNCEWGSFEANPTINVICGLWEENSQGETINSRVYCSIDNSGKLIIKRYNYNQKIVSGTFSFKAINQDDSTDTIEITQGRFDINWGTLNQTNFP
jgi:hypothetical protein